MTYSKLEGINSVPVTKDFDSFLSEYKIKILKYNPEKLRPVTLLLGGTMSIEVFAKNIVATSGSYLLDYPEVFKATKDLNLLVELLTDHAKRNDVLIEPKKPKKQRVVQVPEYLGNLTLNLDVGNQKRDLRFFLSDENEVISPFGGYTYIRSAKMTEDEAIDAARHVMPVYRPRSLNGVFKEGDERGVEINYFNTYIPPKWASYEGDLPDRFPIIFQKLINHLFPLEEEREYFFAWLHASLFERSYVYLVLCGPPAIGKNRLKLLIRALHGASNTTDGKRSTLSERFNSQWDETTLMWFDELHYDLNMENNMKEIQNVSVSIEKKGVDSSRSTPIYASSVISNNKPRDNYIAFDGRKFAPLLLTDKRLDEVMDAEELEKLNRYIEDENKPGFSIKLLAQAGRWIKKHGKKKRFSDKQLEYRGPMFYKLAHTSMSRWQKKAAHIMIDGTYAHHNKVIIDKEKGYLWSALAEVSHKKHADRSLQFPDFSTVQHFFDHFLDGAGKKTFRTESVPKDILGDFYVKIINKKAHIITETEVVGEVDEEDYLDYL